MVILSDGDLVCVFVFFVVWVRSLALGAAGSWVLLGLVYKWRPLWKLSLINTPWG